MLLILRRIRVMPIFIIVLFAIVAYQDLSTLTLIRNAKIYNPPPLQPNLSPNPTPTPIPTPTPTPKAVKVETYTQQQIPTTTPWGVSTQVSEHTWEQKVGSDAQMGTANDVFVALNNYRQLHGVGSLSWDSKLAEFAQTRASSFSSTGKLDEHAGFNDYIKNQDGFNKLGFNHLGENSAFLGAPLAGVHIIEWIFAGDEPHNTNQLNSEWSHVGVGVSGFAIDVVFGGSKQ